jgi:hypothetical protein
VQPGGMGYAEGEDMNTEDDEFNRIEREAAMRKAAVHATVTKKEWIGLTDEEIDNFSREMVKGKKSVNWLSYSIEAKLKEKNEM